MALEDFQNTNNDAVRLGNIPAVPFQELSKQPFCDQRTSRFVDIRPPLDMHLLHLIHNSRKSVIILHLRGTDRYFHLVFSLLYQKHPV